MQIIDTDHINAWPTDVILGYSPVRSDLPEEILRADEQEEYRSFGNADRKNEFLSARALLQFMLSESGLMGDCVIQKAENGKPFLSNDSEGGFVSLSHTKSAVWCAISESRDIGLDAEPAYREIPERMRKRILHHEERLIADDIPDIELWTIKESAVKKTGSGLRMNLNDLIIVERNTNRTEIKINDDYFIQICSFEQLDHQISLAY